MAEIAPTKSVLESIDDFYKDFELAFRDLKDHVDNVQMLHDKRVIQADIEGLAVILMDGSFFASRAKFRGSLPPMCVTKLDEMIAFVKTQSFILRFFIDANFRTGL